MNPAITSAISVVTMIYTVYTMTKMIIQITHKYEDKEFKLESSNVL